MILSLRFLKAFQIGLGSAFKIDGTIYTTGQKFLMLFLVGARGEVVDGEFTDLIEAGDENASRGLTT